MGDPLPTRPAGCRVSFTSAAKIPQKPVIFTVLRWHRGCSKKVCRAATAARPAAPVFRWSTRPSNNFLPGCREGRKDLPAPPCTFSCVQLPVTGFQFLLDSVGTRLTARATELGTGHFRASFAASTRREFPLGVGGAGVHRRPSVQRRTAESPRKYRPRRGTQRPPR